jgi:excisionase family DNA binding protein
MRRMVANRAHDIRTPMARDPRDTSPELCTVEFAASRLKLHPKTVLRFIRDGRLRATRLGKSYRILRADLEALAGVPAPVETPPDDAWVTSIVDIPGIGPELAQKWARTITSALDARPRGGPAMRAEVVYEPERSHLKIVLVGAPGDTANLLNLVRLWLEQLRA